MPRRPLAPAVAALALIALAGCSTGPTDDDRAAWATWSSSLMEQGGDAGLGGEMNPDPDDGLSTLDLGSATAYRAVELRCIGADRAEFRLRYTGTGGVVEATQEIVCHDGDPLTPIAVPTSVGDLETFEATASSPDGEGEWVALLQR